MYNNLPLVCVCIPVFNGAKTIVQTLNSILSQNYANFEIVICDNLSTDNTLEIVAKYQLSDSVKVKIMTNPTKGSAEDNWNYMLGNIKTDAQLIALFHADDIYDKNILSEQIAFMSENDLIASFTLCKLINENGEDITVRKKYKSELPAKISIPIFDFDTLFRYILRFRNFIITPTLVFRKELLNSVSPFFDNKNSYSSSDLDTWLRISKLHKIGIVQKPLLNYRISTTQGSYLINSGRTRLADFFKVIDSHLADISDLTGFKKELKYYNILKAGDLTICAVNLLKQEDSTEAYKLFHKSIKITNILYIKRIKQLKFYLFSLIMYSILSLSAERASIYIAKKIKL
jgi:glycosyltransferase involved in cell wall biosynthesis